MSFLWPETLFSLILIPLLVWAYLRQVRSRRQAASEATALGSLTDASGQPLGGRRHLPPFLFILGLIVLLLGLARPQMTVQLPRVEGTVMLAFDVSNSMAADDLQPTRLEAAKEAARAFVEGQPPTVRIGVVAFGGSGLVVQPPTADQGAVFAAINRLNTQGGTSLAEGIFTSLNAIAGKALAIEQVDEEGTAAELRIEDYSSAVILLITDGENTESPDPLEVAQLAAEAGVRVYPIGIGSAEGALVEVEGFQIVTRLDEGALRQIAQETNGAYFQAEDAETLQEIYSKLDLQLTTRGQEMEITGLVAGLSALLLVVSAGLSLVWFGRVP